MDHEQYADDDHIYYVLNPKFILSQVDTVDKMKNDVDEIREILKIN